MRLVAIRITCCLCAIMGLSLSRRAACAGRAGGAVAAEHPLAATIGVTILAAGGNAVDAATAAAFAVCLLNLGSCGLGGGGFMLVYQAGQAQSYALDFRETAPRKFRPDMLYESGKLDPGRLRVGGLAVGVPGFVAGLLDAQARLGRLTRLQVMKPAISLAQKGFQLGPHLARQIRTHRDAIAKDPELGQLLLDGKGKPSPAGRVVTWPALARTLTAIASRGKDAFYTGEVAAAIVSVVRSQGGVMDMTDLRNYEPRWRQPLEGTYRGLRLLTMPPPSSGGVLLEILSLLSGYELAALDQNSATYLHLLAEAMKAGFRDRAYWYGDPDFTKVPLDRLLSPAYARELRSRVSAIQPSPPAQLPGVTDGGTSHLSVIDRDGNAVSCTVTINTAFGARFTAPGTGIILNNEMDDFSLPRGTPNIYGLVGSRANQIAPGKRPLSSMLPTIALQNGRPVIAIGASGGPRIISATLQVLLNIRDFALDPDQAVARPRIHHQAVPDLLFVEKGITPAAKLALQRLGHKLKPLGAGAAVQVVVSREGKLQAAADPRKGGGAAWR